MAQTVLNQAEVKKFQYPDETRTFPYGKLELLHMRGGDVGRFTVEPGWKWSEHVKAIAKTEWCQAEHFQYLLSGTMHVVMADGKEFDVRAGDVVMIPAGHDAWVVGNEPVVAVDWTGAANYAKKKK